MIGSWLAAALVLVVVGLKMANARCEVPMSNAQSASCSVTDYINDIRHNLKSLLLLMLDAT